MRLSHLFETPVDQEQEIDEFDDHTLRHKARTQVIRQAKHLDRWGNAVYEEGDETPDTEELDEKWSKKYKRSIDCSHPKGFSQRAHCAGKKKHNESVEMEMICPDCGMCRSHGTLSEIKKGQKDSNGFTKCWSGYHAVGTKSSKVTGKPVRNCVKNEDITTAHDRAREPDIQAKVIPRDPTYYKEKNALRHSMEGRSAAEISAALQALNKKYGIKEDSKGSMADAARNPEGAIFKGYWKGTDPNPPKPGMGVGGMEESTNEADTPVTSITLKPRNPVAKNANKAIGGGAAGAHKDKKKAAKQGDVKHKRDTIPVAENFITWAMRQGGKYSDFMTNPAIYESARTEYKKLISEASGPVAWHETYYGGLDEEGEGGELQLGEYYIWKIYFDDGTDKQIKVTDDDFDPYKYYANQNKTVINVDYNWQPHRN